MISIPEETTNPNKKLLEEQLIKQMEMFDNLLRVKAKEDLFIFNRYVLEIEKNKEDLAPFHKELCHFVTDDMKKKKLLLLPRGHLKSTLITVGYSLFRIINNPNIKILILNATWQMAVDFLTEIKNNLTANERIAELFPQAWEAAQEGNRGEWSQDRILLKRTDQNIKGPTVWATGVDSNLVGSHPDLIIMDDVVNRDNTTTREQIEKVILRYKDALDLLEPGGQLIVIGTRWAQGELYSWLMDKDNGVEKSYDIMVKRAYEGNITTGEGFKALWPQKFNRNELQARLREKGWYEFSSQYLNDPVPIEDALFRKEHFQNFDYEDIRGKEMTKTLTIDPAISLSKEADFTAMVGTGFDQFSNLFILDVIREKLNPQQIIDKIFKLQEIWHFNQIGIETIAYQKALAFAIREEMQKRRRYLPLIEIVSHDKTKDQRIKGLQPLYESRKVFHRSKKELPNIVYLEDELLSFPRSLHDDVSDALSMQADLLFAPKRKQTRYQHSYLY